MPSVPVHVLYLVIAVFCEVVGTASLQASQQFTRPGPTILVVVSYMAAFFFLGLTLKVMPVGIVYAIWSGLGIVLIAVIGVVAFGQRLDWPAVLGLGLIITGVAVINLFSNTTTH